MNCTPEEEKIYNFMLQFPKGKAFKEGLSHYEIFFGIEAKDPLKFMTSMLNLIKALRVRSDREFKTFWVQQ